MLWQMIRYYHELGSKNLKKYKIGSKGSVITVFVTGSELT